MMVSDEPGPTTTGERVSCSLTHRPLTPSSSDPVTTYPDGSVE